MPRRARPSGHSGFVVIDKPPQMTSHDVVGAVRRVFNERRVGHGGTLDPDATGVLVVAVGPTTRLLRFCSELDKTYEGELVLGVATDSLDASGTITARHDMSHVSEEHVRAAATAFVGHIKQLPPMVSAVKVQGRRLYELAREGLEVERAERPVCVQRFDLSPTVDPLVYRFVVECSSGTYVRSLCADLGAALGGSAHLGKLRRVAIGPFGLDRAVALSDLEVTHLQAPTGLLAHLERVVVGVDLAGAIRHGQVLSSEQINATGPGPWAIVFDDELLAVYQAHGDGRAKPIVVLADADGLTTAEQITPAE